MSQVAPALLFPANAAHDAGVELSGRRLHFSGIGGSGMSGLARMAKKRGAQVTGSDKGGGPAVEALQTEGFAVSAEQTEASVPWGTEVLVISAAIKNDHPEVVEARRRNLEIVKYAQMLGALMRGRIGVAIAGTHGKSTTTSILAHILISTGLDPSFIVGANCPQIGGGSRTSGKAGTLQEVLVAEACEYDRSFHNFHPTHAVILNVEADHLDIYSGIEEIVESFAFFARKLPQHPNQGSLLIHHESPHRFKITAGLDCKVETIGFATQADWQVEILPAAQVRLRHQGEVVCAFHSPMPGDHFAYNASCAAVLARRAGAPWEEIGKAITSFAGLDRRMQRLGQMKIERPGVSGQATIIDDYGHHPTEIDTTLRAQRQYYRPKRLVCVFQPHQHSRTRFLMEEFATAFSAANVVMVPEIYFSRDSEQERRAVTAGDLVARLRKCGVTAWHVSPLGAIVEQLRETARDGDLIVTMGAGDVWTVSHELVKGAVI